MPVAAFGQVTVSPFQGLGSVQFFDNNGEPLTSGVLYSFEAGTTTQQATYTDSSGTALNPNPIPFGSGARVNIWLVSADFYKFVLCSENDGSACAPADVLFSVDNVPGSPASASSGSPFTGTFISGTIGPATSGILRLATADTICWRNAAGTANLCISKSTNDVLTWPNPFSALSVLSTCTPASLTGFLRLCDTDTIGWRNHANTGDVLFSKDSSDNLVWPNGLSLGGAAALPSTAQSGTGSLCMTTSCALTTPAINGVAFSASTPVAAGYCITSTGTAAADWEKCVPTTTAATSGEIVFPSGVIMQWFQGSTDSATEGTYDHNFPTAFPNAVWNIQVAYQEGSSSAADDCWYQISSFTTSTVTLRKQGTGGTCQTSIPHIFAIGN